MADEYFEEVMNCNYVCKNEYCDNTGEFFNFGYCKGCHFINQQIYKHKPPKEKKCLLCGKRKKGKTKKERENPNWINLTHQKCFNEYKIYYPAYIIRKEIFNQN